MTMGIYCIHNTVNHKRYIGSSKNAEHRFAQHRHNLRRGAHTNNHLQSAWYEYGENAFTFSILESVDSLDGLVEREAQLVTQYDTCNRLHGYNANMPDEDNTRFIMSEETKRKIAYIISHPSEETRKKRSHAAKNRSEETRRKMSDAAKGRVASDEVRRKLSEAHKNPPEHIRQRLREVRIGKKASEETRRKMSESAKRRLPESIEGMRKANTGRIVSDETKRKIGDANRRIWALKKANYPKDAI